jgi:hypothetical protein
MQAKSRKNSELSIFVEKFCLEYISVIEKIYEDE